MDEQSLRKRFTLRTGHDDCRQEQGPEPMQVDHYRPNRGLCYNCHRRGHVAKNCMLKKKMSVNAAEHSSNQYSGQVTCWRCGKKGHIKKNCRVVLSEKSQGQGQGN